MKTISFRASDYDLERIQVIKEFLSQHWKCYPNEISTSEIIKYAIGYYYYDTPKGEEERKNNLSKKHICD